MNNKPKYSLTHITTAVCSVLMILPSTLMDITDTGRRITENRYMVFALMEKAGYTHQQIADHFKMNRETITKALGKLDGWLEIYKDMAGTYTRLVTLVLKED